LQCASLLPLSKVAASRRPPARPPPCPSIQKVRRSVFRQFRVRDAALRPPGRRNAPTLPKAGMRPQTPRSLATFRRSATVPVAPVGVSPTDSSFSPFTIQNSTFPDHLLGEAGSLPLMIRAQTFLLAKVLAPGGRVQTPLRNMESTAITTREFKAGKESKDRIWGINIVLPLSRRGRLSDCPSLALSRREGRQSPDNAV